MGARVGIMAQSSLGVPPCCSGDRELGEGGPGYQRRSYGGRSRCSSVGQISSHGSAKTSRHTSSTNCHHIYGPHL